MEVGIRIYERLKALRMSQSELARRVGVTQGTISQLIKGGSSGSRYLHRIARELATTPAYLTGETDDPDAGAPPPVPAPRYQLISMDVALPSESILTQMFRGVLLASEALDGDALARELARQLPRALGLARGPLIEIDLPETLQEGGPMQEAADGQDDALLEPRRARRR